MSKTVEAGGVLDPSALTELLDAVEARAKHLGAVEPMRSVRRARDCLASCPTQEKMLSRARAALQAVRQAERAGSP